MLSLLRKQFVFLIPRFELHGFVTDSQRAHLQLAEVSVAGRIGDGGLHGQHEAGNERGNGHATLYPRGVSSSGLLLEMHRYPSHAHVEQAHKSLR